MFIVPILLAFSFLMIIVGVRLVSICFRSKRLLNLQLRPNCLLTRSPIVFVTGRRSLFYFLNYWNEIPSFLREHGYQVEVCSLPWRGFDSRFKSLTEFVERSRKSVHLVGDTTSNRELQKLLLLTSRNQIASVGFAEEITGENRLQNAIGLTNDRSWALESKYLDHVIALAEKEHS